MTLNNYAIVFVSVAIGVASYFGIVPVWVFVVVGIFALAVLGQRYAAYSRELKAKWAAKEAEEQRLIAEQTPELVGKDFLQTFEYVQTAVGKFNANSSPLLRQVFCDALLNRQAAYKSTGESMPPWAVLSLLREIESAFPDGGADLQHLQPLLDSVRGSEEKESS